MVGVNIPLFLKPLELRELEFKALEFKALVLRLVLTSPPVHRPPEVSKVGVGFRTLLELTTLCTRPACLFASC